jgi:hypothetical protein
MKITKSQLRKIIAEELNEGWEQALAASEPDALFARLRELYEDLHLLLSDMETAGIEDEVLESTDRAVKRLVDALKVYRQHNRIEVTGAI